MPERIQRKRTKGWKTPMCCCITRIGMTPMPEYPVGGRTCRGPVDAAYAETGAIDVHCPNCHAIAGDWCVHADGTPRKIPCPRRIPHTEEPE